jgi:hypothetical protein
MNIQLVFLRLQAVSLPTGSVQYVRASSVSVEAESAVLGSDWAASNSSSPVCISITSN